MLCSNSALISSLKKFILLSIMVVLTGCLRSASDPQSPGVTSDATGDFKALEISGKSVESSRNPHWQVPTEKTYDYRVCLISRTTNAQLPIGQTFQLKSPDGSFKEIKTDNLGCINWTEVVPFNFSSDAYYIEKTRTLIGKGTYRGSSLLKFAINPWLNYRGNSGEEVVDLQRGNNNIPQERLIKEAAEDGVLAGLFSRSSSRNLLLELMPGLEIIDTGDRKDGKSLKIIVQLKPFIEPLDMNNDRSKVFFNTGRFKVYVQLVGNYVGESGKPQTLILAPGIEPQEVSIKSEGTIVFKQDDVPLTRQITTGQVQLAVKVVPIDPPFPMNPYEGLYNAGSFDTIFKKAWVTQIQGSQDEAGFDYSQHLKSSANFDELKEQQWAHDLAPIVYSNLEPRFVQVKQGETSTQRTIIYRVSTQVTNGVDGSPIVKQPFTIVHPKESCVEETVQAHAEKIHADGTCEETVATDDRGYLYWRDELTHLYYEREHRILQDFKIIHKRSGRQDTFTLALNPWDEGWTFGGDLRSKIIEKDYKFDAGDKKPNLLMVDAFRYQTIRFRYVIDEFLTLNVKKAVVMAMDPLVQRDTLYRGRIFEPLRDGVYLVKLALVKYYIDPFQNGLHLHRNDCEENGQKVDCYRVQAVSEGGEARKGQYTTVIKKLLRIQAGRITTPIEFSMRDLRMMSIRSNIMVQLETIDERRLLRDNIIDQRLDELERQYFELHPETMTEDDKEAFLARYGFLPTEMTEAQKQQVMAERAAEFEAERQKLLEFVADTREQLEASRAEQRNLQQKRFELVDRIEKGLEQGSAQLEYEKKNPLLSLPRGEFDEIISGARANLGEMEMTMKKHWSHWDQDWSEVLTDYDNGNYVMAGDSFRRTYFDYLAVMQTFLKDNNIDGVITEREMDRLKINNYTQNPVAPIVDLNLYRNKSGLKRRTFIGPCTLVENDNMSEMRPTDTVDEKYCDRIDCGEVLYEPRVPLPDNSEFENSAHHDSLKPFASMHVDEVIKIHQENELRYEMEMDALSQMGNFTRSFNLEYVSLTDQPLRIYKQGCRFDGEEDCFPETTEGVTSANGFVDQLNSESLRQLLQKYFYTHPMHELLKVNDEVDALEGESRRDQLQPLWDRASKDSGLFFNMISKVDTTLPPLEYRPSERAFGNHYVGAAKKYLDENYGSREDVTVSTSDVSQWLNKGVKGMKLEDALRICTALSKQAARELKQAGVIDQDYHFLSSGPTHSMEEQLQLRCFSRIKYLPRGKEVFFDGIHFDRRYKVLETGRYEHIAGMNMNINVGVDFGISSYQDVNTASSMGLNDSAVLGLPAAGIGLGLALTGAASAPLLIAGGAAVAATGGLFVASRASTEAEGVGRSTGTSVNAATFLVVQKADFDIRIRKHEKCVTLKFGAEFVESLDADQLELKDDIKVKDQKVQKALTRGYMVCDGVETDKNETIRESYYYVTQHFTAGDMLDDVNLLNHVWLLSLRGKRDFNEFIRILKSKEINSKGEVIGDGEIYDYSLSRLGKVYKQVVPTFPGMYSVREQ